MKPKPRPRRRLHIADIRLKNNAGINVPVCHAGTLYPEKTYQYANPTTAATCKHCRQLYPRRYPWTGYKP